MKYVLKPNLPSADVTAVAISQAAGEAIKKLNSLGITTYKIKPYSGLPEGLASHADIQMLHLGGNRILTANEHLCVGELSDHFSLIAAGELLSAEYPADVPLNATIVGNHIILNERTVSKTVLNFANQSGLTIISSKQGYSKCSVCVIDDNSIITDDPAIAASAGKILNDVLFVSKGAIRLKGFNYGFIGGCCGKIGKDKLAFNGRIECHPDYKQIIDFAEEHSVSVVELANCELTDIGGILPLCI